MKDDKPRGVKVPLRLIPLRALWPIADVFGDALAKYGPRSWAYATDDGPEVYAEAAARHVLAWLDGEAIDPESGRSHLAHAGASILIAVWHEARIGVSDD